MSSVSGENNSLTFHETTGTESNASYNNKRSCYFGDSVDIADEFHFDCLFFFLVFFLPPKEDVSIIDAVCLMDPVEIDNNDSHAFCWTKIIKSPRVLIICVTGF